MLNGSQVEATVVDTYCYSKNEENQFLTLPNKRQKQPNRLVIYLVRHNKNPVFSHTGIGE